MEIQKRTQASFHSKAVEFAIIVYRKACSISAVSI